LSPKVDEGLRLLIWQWSSDAGAAAPDWWWLFVDVFSAVSQRREAEYIVSLDAGGCGFGRAAWR
jgi:hypothetical protein